MRSKRFSPTSYRKLFIERLSLRLMLAADIQSDHYDDDGSLRFDSDGLAYYFDPEFVPESKLDSPDLPVLSGPGLLSVPVYHSNPGFTKKIYLDFDGQQITGTTWNNKVFNGTYNTGNVIDAPAFSLDSDLTTFSPTELAAIQDTWARVAEDYAPFQVDVTTESPSASAFTAGGQAIRVMISTDTDATTGQQWYPSAGGVAYLNSWTWTNGTPVWVFRNRLGTSSKNFAEAASHEVGHAFNLSHDGRVSPAETYYGGHGSGATGWAPIMGVGYSRNLTTWSRGEYTSANNTQDDLAIISNTLGYIADDHGSTPATSTDLVVGNGGAVASSGLITTRADVDAFRFATQAGSVTINVNPFDFTTSKANLDVQISLLNAAGTVLTAVNNASLINATLTSSLAKGVYTLLVDGIGRGAITGDLGYSDYASIGKYALSGNVIPNAAPVAVADTVLVQSSSSILVDVLANDTDANADVLSVLSFGAPSAGVVVLEFGKLRFTPPAGFIGTATFPYIVADELGATATGLVSVNVVVNTPPAIASNQTAVTGSEGLPILNSGTWSDVGDTVTFAASIGSVTQAANGTWAWSFTPADDTAATSVTITVTDSIGFASSTTFTYTASNIAPVLTRNLATVTGGVQTTISNTGTYTDVSADTVTLTADVGSLVANANGTWSWSLTPVSLISNQTVTVTATDEDGGTTNVTFLLNAIAAPRVQNVVFGDGGNQRSLVREITVDFDSVVNIASGAFLLERKNGASWVSLATELSIGLATSLFNNNTRATLTFSGTGIVGGSLADGNYRLTLIATSITKDGIAIDGDGNGIAGGDLVRGESAVDNFFRLYGDFDGNRVINGLDLGRFRLTNGTSVGDAAFNPLFDFNGDGVINGIDLGQFRIRNGSSLEF